jgi:hypothetical protein
MKKLLPQILNYLEDQGHPFSNAKGVEICLSNDESIFACSDVPGFAEQDLFKLEYLSTHEPIKDFINKFSINSVEDLDQIEPKKLEKLYYLGKAQLWCHIYPSEEYLIFTKMVDCILVSDDEMEHRLGTELITHEDYHLYTRYYFSA